MVAVSGSPGAVRVTTLGLAMVGAQLVVRGWVSAGGFLYEDDFVLQSRAARLPFPSSELLLTTVDGRLSPGGMTAAWLTTTVAPLSQVGVVVGLLVFQAAASLAVLAMLLRVFGRRKLVLVPFAVYLVSPLTLPAFVWWAPALSSLPLQAGLALAVWGHVGYLRSGRRLDLALSAAAVGVALVFSEKAVLIPLGLFGVTWILDGSPGLVGSWWSALRSHWRLWLSWLLVAAGYLAWYRSVVDPPGRAGSDAGEWWRFARQGLVDAFVVPAVGGPVSWDAVGYGNALAAAPAWMRAAGCAVAVLVVAGTSWASPRARRGWIVLAVYLTAAVGAATLTRPGSASDLASAVLTVRFTADAAVLLAVAIGVSLMAPAGLPDPPRVTGLRRHFAAHPTAAGLAAFVALDVFVLLSAVSTVQLASVWADNPARPWVTNATRSLALAPTAAAIIPEPVPEEVMSPLTFPDNLTGRLLAPVAGGHTFASGTTALRTFEPSGVLVAARVRGTPSVAAPSSQCWPVENGRGVVDLLTRQPAWEYVAHLSYLADRATEGTVALGVSEPVPVSFARGVGDVFVVVSGGGSRLYLTLDDVDARVCVTRAVVGTVEPGEELPR